MKHNKKDNTGENMGVEEYLVRRRLLKREEIKKEQEKFPEPFSHYSSFLLLSL